MCRPISARAPTRVTRSRHGTFQTWREAPPAGRVLRVDFRAVGTLLSGLPRRPLLRVGPGRERGPRRPLPISGHRLRGKVAGRARVCVGCGRPGLRAAAPSRASRQDALLTARRTQHPHGSRASRQRQGGSPAPSRRRGHASAARRRPGRRGRSFGTCRRPARPASVTWLFRFPSEQGQKRWLHW